MRPKIGDVYSRLEFEIWHHLTATDFPQFPQNRGDIMGNPPVSAKWTIAIANRD